MASTANTANFMQPQLASTVNAANFVPTRLWFSDRDNNFVTWKCQMLGLIESQGFHGFIDGSILPPPETVNGPPVENQDYLLWKRTDSLVKCWILRSLSDNMASALEGLNTSREIWLEVENRFHRHVSTTVQSSNATTNTTQKDLQEYLPLYKATLAGNWEAAKQIFYNDPYAPGAKINITGATALHVAVATGEKAIHFVKNLVAIMPDESIATQDTRGNTALWIAASVGNTEAATILVNRLHSLLYIPDKSENFPVQMAALYAHEDMLKYLISVTRDDQKRNPYDREHGLRLLKYLISTEFLDVALDLVGKYPHVARLKLPDSNSALKLMAGKKSVFSSCRHFNFLQRFISWLFQKLHAILWILIEKLVPQIRSIKHKSLVNQQALRLVKCLCEEMESLSDKEAADIYSDAILSASELGIHEVVELIVEAFPSAIYCHDASGQYIFHMAVKNRSEDVFNLIHQMSDHKSFFLDVIDNNGNNLLHLAGTIAPSHKLNETTGAALQMQREMKWYKEVENLVHPSARELKNRAGETPKMVFTEQHKKLKEEGEKWMKDTSDSCAIVAALIIAAMFGASIAVPGGNEDNTGFPIFSREMAFIVFAISDAASLFTSTASLLMFLSIMTSRYAEEDFLHALPKRLIIGLGTLFLSITFMMVSFSATVYLVFGQKKAWVLIPVAALACLPVTLFVLLQFPLLIDLISSTYGPGIFGKKSNRPFH